MELRFNKEDLRRYFIFYKSRIIVNFETFEMRGWFNFLVSKYYRKGKKK
jgi:hypothetical protein